MKNPRTIMKKIPKPIRKMVIRAAADTAAGKLMSKIFESGAGQKTVNRAAGKVLGTVFPEKPHRVKLQSIHGSNHSVIDRLADLGVTTAVTAPLKRMQQRKRRTDIAGTAVVALTKVLMRVKWK